MLLPFIITKLEHISLPNVVYTAEIEEGHQHDEFLSSVESLTFDRIVIAYTDASKPGKNASLNGYGLYVKPLKLFRKNKKLFITYKGIEVLNLLHTPYSFKESDLSEADAKTFLKNPEFYIKNMVCEKISKSNKSSDISDPFEMGENVTSFLTMLKQSYKALEDMKESILKINPENGKQYKMVDILNAQKFDKEPGFRIEDYPEIFLNTILSYTKKIDGFWDLNEYLILQDPKDQFTYATNIARYASKVIEVETEIQSNMEDSMLQQQKEFMLREKIKAIKSQLETMDSTESEEDEYKKLIKNKKTAKIYPESVQKIIKDENERYSQMMASSPDANITRTYIETLKKLPWRKTEINYLDIKKAREVLDKHHYGLDEVKERIIEHLAVILNNRKHNNNSKNLIPLDSEHEIDLELFKQIKVKDGDNTYNNVPILALVGPPGTGKTSLSKAIAEALQKSFVKISLGGVHDESEIRGHRRTYVGAMPGKIVKSFLKCEVSNPLILLDEIDKMASDTKGDPASAMLEVLDPEQNSKFQDHYLEHEYDLSKVMFIATANEHDGIPAPLLDRVEIIELSPYTITEKIKIAKQHLINKVLEQTSLTPELFKIDDDTLKYIIKHYTLEAGVRGLKRLLDKIARKIVVKVIDDPKLKKFEIKKEMLIDLIGIVKFKEEEREVEEVKGTVTGLAYSIAGGSTLQIEVTAYPGKGEIKLTGQLKDVMQESAQIALTYVRANASKFGINDFDFEGNTIHIHVPEGAIPKDGPSAGVTFTTAIISALSGKTVKNIYGMTGEITLRGKVLEIGGLKEKSFAATQKGLTHVFIPYNNIKNLKDIPDEIKDLLIYIPVKKYSEIYDVIFNGKKPEITIDKSNNKKLSVFY
ncbi:endopeptidase La [Mycoplasma crocodyli]|uniref:endopeptidase La n=1 Tax=Mycoplasma crocodyli (strain ATCC 51981 / MP145) TaxID=512564 RepID=D5E538_MYCCM|nr:endopeptidase La [Mycoplasma crocodyli]ADE19648.1 serine-type ATP-dependent endopeptidase La (Lon) [Mycoplasma crocodyli MP145]